MCGICTCGWRPERQGRSLPNGRRNGAALAAACRGRRESFPIRPQREPASRPSVLMPPDLDREAALSAPDPADHCSPLRRATDRVHHVDVRLEAFVQLTTLDDRNSGARALEKAEGRARHDQPRAPAPDPPDPSLFLSGRSRCRGRRRSAGSARGCRCGCRRCLDQPASRWSGRCRETARTWDRRSGSLLGRRATGRSASR